MNAEIPLNKDIPLIGHTTKWLSAKVSSSPLIQRKILSAANSETIEIFCTEGSGLEISNNLRFNKDQVFKDVSLRLPNFTNFEKASKTKLKLVGKALSAYISHHQVDYTILNAERASKNLISWLYDYNIPIAIENAENSKQVGKLPLEMMRMCNDFDAPLVLNLQNAFETSVATFGEKNFSDIAAQLALMAKKGTGIAQIHICGEVKLKGVVYHNNASLLYATNKQEILKLLKLVLQTFASSPPTLLLKGDYLPQLSNDKIKLKSRNRLREIAEINMKLERNLVLKELSNQNQVDLCKPQEALPH